MEYGLYAIKDARSAFMPPVPERSDAVAKRNFSHAVLVRDSIFRDFPNDFSFYLVGSFDDQSGEVVHCQPVFLIDAAEILSAQKE